MLKTTLSNSHKIFWYLFITSLLIPVLTVFTGIGISNDRLDYLKLIPGAILGLVLLSYFFKINFTNLSGFNKHPIRIRQSLYTLLLALPFTIIPIISSFFYLATSHQCYSDPQASFANTVAFFVMATLIGPLEEEVFFRGILFNFFKNKYSLLLSIFLTSLLFSLTHLDPLSIISTFTVGIITVIIYYRWGNLFYPILFHALFNGLPQVCGLISFVTPR